MYENAPSRAEAEADEAALAADKKYQALLAKFRQAVSQDPWIQD